MRKLKEEGKEARHETIKRNEETRRGEKKNHGKRRKDKYEDNREETRGRNEKKAK